MEKFNIRYFIGFVLIIVLIIGISLSIKNYDKWFLNKVELTYPDGCVETFNNGKLITPECKEGRKFYEDISKQLPPIGDSDLERLRWIMENKSQ